MEKLNLVKSQEWDITIYTAKGTRITDPQQIIDDIGLDPTREYVSDKEARAFEWQQKWPDWKPTILQMWSVAVKIKSLHTPSQENFLDAIKQIAPPTWSSVEPMSSVGKRLWLVGIYDAHFWKLDFKGTSLSKQVKSVVTGAKQAIDKLCDRDVDIILQVWWGDTWNTDHANKTTKGTEQENNSRSIDEYKATSEAQLELADYSGRLKKTMIEVLSGNHDEEKALCHRHFLTHMFKDHPNVQILQHDTDHNVVKHWQVWLLLHHGDKLKPKDIVGIINKFFTGVKYYEANTWHSHTRFFIDFAWAKQRWHWAAWPKNPRSTNVNVWQDYHEIQSVIYDHQWPIESFITRLK